MKYFSCPTKFATHYLIFPVVFLLVFASCSLSPSQGADSVTRGDREADTNINDAFARRLDEITFGPEFEFDYASNSHDQNSTDKVLEIHSSLREKLMSKAPIYDVLENGFMFHLPDTSPEAKFFARMSYTKESSMQAVIKREHFRITLYPRVGDSLFNEPVVISFTRDDVLFEVQLSPLRLSQLQKVEKIVEDLVFDTMRTAGLAPPRNGGGHIHIGLDSVRKFHENLSALDRTIFEYVKLILFESSEYARHFLRPHPNFAIFPAMASELGRSVAYDAMDGWYKVDASDNFGGDEAFYKAWLSERIDEVSLSKFFDELRFGSEPEEPLRFFKSNDQRLLNMKRFAIKPHQDAGFYPAIRHHFDYNTLELRFLPAQKKMSDFIDTARFFGGILVSISQNQALTKKALDKDIAVQAFLQLGPTFISDEGKEQAFKLFNLADIESKEDRLRTIQAMMPRVLKCTK